MTTIKTNYSGRKAGHLMSIIFNSAILYVINFVPLWDHIPVLTEKFADTRGAMSLSLGVSIFMYCTFLAFDPRWFRSLMQSIANVFAIYSLWIFRQVFPLDVSESMAGWINIGLLVLMGIMVLSTLIELASSIRHYRRSLQE